MTSGSTNRDRAGFRVVLVMLVMLVMLLGGSYATAYVSAQDKTPRGTQVAGVKIGGRTLAAAVAALRAGLDTRTNAPITLDVGGRRTSVLPAEVGLGIDYVASVRAAGAGRSWDPSRLWNYYTGGDQLQPVVTVSEMTMTDYVAGVVARSGGPARDGRVRFQGQRVLVDPPKDGRTVDPQQARDAIVAAYLQDDPTAEIPLVATTPDVDEDDVRAAVTGFANPAVSGAVALELGDLHVLLQPRDFAGALSLRPENGTLVPHVAQGRITALVRSAISGHTSPVDARAAMVDGRPHVLPSRVGVSFDPAAVTAAFMAAVVKPLGERSAPVSVQLTEPQVATEDVRALKIREQVSTSTVSYGDDPDRNAGIGQAARLIDGTVLRPGDAFSFNQTVGPLGDAGGGTQSATAVFGAAFLAGLGDLVRTSPATHTGGYPVGLEATVGPSDDLTFTNTTPYGVLVQAAVTPSAPGRPGVISVTMWSKATWSVTSTRSARYHLVEPGTVVLDTADCRPSAGHRGFDVDVSRHLHHVVDPSLDHDEVLHTTYAPIDAVACQPVAG